MNRQKREQYLRESIRNSELPIAQKYLEFHVFNPLRLQALRGALADYILRLQHNESPANSVFAALVPSLSDKILRLLQRYQHNYHPSLQWILLDVRGNGQAVVDGDLQSFRVRPLAVEKNHFSSSSESGANSTAHTRPSAFSGGNMFTPNNQWLLKVLLLSGIDDCFWGGPELPADFGVSDLAGGAQIPQSSVSRFVTLAEKFDFITRSRNRLAIKRIPELLDQWVFYLRNNPDHTVNARFLYPVADSDNQLLKLSNQKLIAGGQLAIEALNLSISNFEKAVFYTPDINQALDDNELVECRKEDAVFELRQPSAEAAVFNGSVTWKGHRLADILQLYLDARLSAVRGEEQAEHIFDKILAPFLREKQWL